MTSLTPLSNGFCIPRERCSSHFSWACLISKDGKGWQESEFRPWRWKYKMGGTLGQTEENSRGRCWYRPSMTGNRSKRQRLPKQNRKKRSGWKTTRGRGQDVSSSEDIRWENRIMTLSLGMSHWEGEWEVRGNNSNSARTGRIDVVM